MSMQNACLLLLNKHKSLFCSSYGTEHSVPESEVILTFLFLRGPGVMGVPHHKQRSLRVTLFALPSPDRPSASRIYILKPKILLRRQAKEKENHQVTTKLSFGETNLERRAISSFALQQGLALTSDLHLSRTLYLQFCFLQLCFSVSSLVLAQQDFGNMLYLCCFSFVLL